MQHKEKKCEYCNVPKGKNPRCKFCSTTKDDWETKEREAWVKEYDNPEYDGEGNQIADYWLARIRAAREEAVSAYKQELHEKICALEKGNNRDYDACMFDVLALLRAPNE